MALQQIEFELPAQQFKAMGYPDLRQGHALTLVLDGGVLLPDPGASFWYSVQPEAPKAQLVSVGSGIYAFAGQISEAEIEYGGEQLAVLAVDCGGVSLRVTCAPLEDGALPEGTWETRHIVGLAALQGMVEDSFEAGIGPITNVTVWRFRRLVLTPGDPNFGSWHETDELPSSPYLHDRIYIEARVHRAGV